MKVIDVLECAHTLVLARGMRITPEISAQIFRAREARGWSQAELADRAGTHQQTVDRIEKGQSKQSQYVADLLRALDLPLNDERSTTVRGAPAKIVSGDDLVGERDLPVHTAAEGGDGALIVSNEAIEYVKRPQPLVGVPNAYGLYVVGDSMQPRYEQGDTVLVHPGRPPGTNVDVVLYRADHGDHYCIVKRLRRATKDKWLLTQWNPPPGEERDFELPRDEWPVCHVIVGAYSKR